MAESHERSICEATFYVAKQIGSRMVPPAGFEPTTFRSEAGRSIQLSYEGITKEC
jgi:hypothetical protein